MAAAKDKLTAPIPPHRVLREIYRHYIEFREHVGKTGDHVIEHGYFVYDEDGAIADKILITISFWDLVDSLKSQKDGGILSDRKREAVFYNVILDWKQATAAAKMGITTVSVGQYVDQAMIQLSKEYFVELFEEL